MNLTRHNGNVFLSPDRQPKNTMPDPDGTKPSWEFDSDTNEESWKDTLFDMGKECHEIKAREQASREPAPVEAWLGSCEDEVVIVLDNDTSLLMGVRHIAGRGYESLFTPDTPISALWNRHKEKMRNLGFNMYKIHDGTWRMVFRTGRKNE